MREGLFMLGASCGINSPSKFTNKHIALRETNNNIRKYDYFTEQPASSQITHINELKSSKDREMDKEKELVKS